MSCFSRSLLLLLAAGVCAAQTPAQPQSPAPTSQAATAPVPQSELPLNRRIENQLRTQYSIPPTIDVIVGEVKPSDMPGFDTLPVTMKTSNRNTTLDFLISKDKKTLAHLEKFDLTTDPTSKINLAGRPVRGNKDAKITIISYDDFQCPYCAMMHKTLTTDLPNIYGDRIRIIYKDYPLFSIHPWADHAAVDANCLNQQSGTAYWNFADYIHANQSSVTMNKDAKRPLPEQNAELDRLTIEQGKKDHLDGAKLQACVKTQDDASVLASAKEGVELGVDSTPTLFVNGEKLSGAVPLQALLPIINRALRSEGVSVPAAAEPAPPAKAEPAAAAPPTPPKDKR